MLAQAARRDAEGADGAAKLSCPVVGQPASGPRRRLRAYAARWREVRSDGEERGLCLAGCALRFVGLCHSAVAGEGRKVQRRPSRKGGINCARRRAALSVPFTPDLRLLASQTAARQPSSACTRSACRPSEGAGRAQRSAWEEGRKSAVPGVDQERGGARSARGRAETGCAAGQAASSRRRRSSLTTTRRRTLLSAWADGRAAGCCC